MRPGAVAGAGGPGGGAFLQGSEFPSLSLGGGAIRRLSALRSSQLQEAASRADRGLAAASRWGIRQESRGHGPAVLLPLCQRRGQNL